MRVAWAFDLLAFLPHAIPNIIFAVGAIIIALFWVPNFIPFYGTIYILIVVYVITRISFATRIYNSSLLQIHRELDEAGNVFGLNTVLVIWHILRPLMAPVLLYTWVWMALLVYRELTIAVLLTTPNNITVPVYIFGLFQNNFAMAAAASVVLMLGILPLVLLYFAVGRRRLDLVR